MIIFYYMIKLTLMLQKGLYLISDKACPYILCYKNDLILLHDKPALMLQKGFYLLHKSKVKLATIVEGNPKAPFSITTTPRCRGGHYYFPGWLYFTLDPHLIMLSVKQGGIKYHFLSLWYDSTWDWTQVSRTIGEHFSLPLCYKKDFIYCIKPTLILQKGFCLLHKASPYVMKRILFIA